MTSWLHDSQKGDRGCGQGSTLRHGHKPWHLGISKALLDSSALRLRLSTIGCWAEHLATAAHSVEGQRWQRDKERTLRQQQQQQQQEEEEEEQQQHPPKTSYCHPPPRRTRRTRRTTRRRSSSCERTVEDMEAPLDLSWKLDDTWHPPRPAGRGFGDHLRKKRCIRSLANKSEERLYNSKIHGKVCENTWSPNKAKKQGSCRAWRILENQINKHLEPVSFRKHSNKLHLCALEESKSPAKLLFRFAAAATLKSVPVLSQHQQFSRLWPLLPTADDTRLGKIRLAPGT